jgi:CheY-like chemotaxis protein
MTATQRVTTAFKSSAAKNTLRRSLQGRLQRSLSEETAQGLQGSDSRGILIVDSDPGHSEQILTCLGRMGFVVETCSELREAVLKLRENRYEVVVVNISNRAKSWSQVIHDLQEVARGSGHHLPPSFICISATRLAPGLRFDLEQKGVRVTHER